AAFPRDKACGDLVGPRGVQVLTELGVDVPGARRVGDMAVIGPTGSRVVLPAVPGRTYPGYAIAVTRVRFDAVLRDAELEAGCVPVSARVARCTSGDDRQSAVVTLDDGTALRAGAVVGADGALSVIAETAGLCDPD